MRALCIWRWNIRPLADLIQSRPTCPERVNHDLALRALFAAFLLLPLAFAPANAMEKHKLALQISDASPEKMNAVLNVAANVSKYYSDKGDEVEIEIVAFNAGLNMLRADKSPVLERLKSFKQGMPNVARSWPARTRSTP